MYIDALEWRRRVNPTHLYETYQPVAVLRWYYPGGFLGVDKGGCACFYDRAGLLDPKGVLKHATNEEICKLGIWRAEHTTRINRALSGRVQTDQITMIQDLKGLGVHHISKVRAGTRRNAPQRAASSPPPSDA
jgi:hypothetical protein